MNTKFATSADVIGFCVGNVFKDGPGTWGKEQITRACQDANGLLITPKNPNGQIALDDMAIVDDAKQEMQTGAFANWLKGNGLIAVAPSVKLNAIRARIAELKAPAVPAAPAK